MNPEIDPKKFIESLNIGKPEGKDKIENIKTQAYVILGSLLSFDSSVSKELVDDIIDIALFVQLASSASSCDRLKDAKNWYKQYTKYMTMLGWDSREFDFERFKSHKQVFEISTAVIDKGKEIEAGNKEMVATIEKSLEALKKANNETVELFHSKSTGCKNGNFQIGTCTEDKSGIVTMASVNGYFTTDETIKDFLNFKYDNTKMALFMSASKLMFNKNLYDKVRVEVQKKLGDSAKKDVRKLPDFTVINSPE